jgi:hypothetical protein
MATYRKKTYSNRTRKVVAEGKKYIKCDVENCRNADGAVIVAQYSCPNKHMICPVHAMHDVTCTKLGVRCPICKECIEVDGVNREADLGTVTNEKGVVPLTDGSEANSRSSHSFS